MRTATGTRFNALFPHNIRPTGAPKACPVDDVEQPRSRRRAGRCGRRAGEGHPNERLANRCRIVKPVSLGHDGGLTARGGAHVVLGVRERTARRPADRGH